MLLRSLCAIAALPLAAFAQSGTTPLILEENVPMIDVEFARADGSTVTGRFLIDSGGGAFIIGEKLADRIGLKASGPRRKSEGSELALAPAPTARVGGMPLDLKDARVLINYGDMFTPRDAVEGMFPGHVLERYHVIFDYPGRKFTLAAPGSVKPRGVAVDSPVRQQNGFVRLQVGVAGRIVGFLLDTGASYTMISRTAMEEWSSAASPRWPQLIGAIGPANMGSPSDAQAMMVRIPELQLAGATIAGAGAVSREPGTYEKSMSNAVGGSILGALAGNVLRQFRVEIDYAAQKTYFERTGSSGPDDLNLIGLSLSPGPGGSLRVTGVSPAADQAVRDQVQRGDLLRSVDGASIEGMSIMQVVMRLRGKPGEQKRLGLERDGKAFTLQAAVTRIL